MYSFLSKYFSAPYRVYRALYFFLLFSIHFSLLIIYVLFDMFVFFHLIEYFTGMLSCSSLSFVVFLPSIFLHLASHTSCCSCSSWRRERDQPGGRCSQSRVAFIIGLSRSTLIQPSSNFPLVSKVPCNIQGGSAAPLGPSGSISPQ